MYTIHYIVYIVERNVFIVGNVKKERERVGSTERECKALATRGGADCKQAQVHPSPKSVIITKDHVGPLSLLLR